MIKIAYGMSSFIRTPSMGKAGVRMPATGLGFSVANGLSYICGVKLSVADFCMSEGQ